VQSALQDSRVVAAFQPIVDLRTGARVGDEAFARIIALDNSVIPAARFIEAAESLHLAASVDEAIASHALSHGTLAGEANNGTPEAASLTHFINLSPQFLANRDSVEMLIRRAGETGLAQESGGRFVVEITERQGGDLESLKKSLKPLVDAGFRLALDDFGSGYSSFQYLADLPIGYLKVEGWMVARAVSDSRIRQLLESIVATAQKFKLITVAECVEEASTAEVLCDLGVDWAQGYLFGAPALDRDSHREASTRTRPARREARRR
jgi:EAL domain-containing protein (putative c-di-GMP-specific phosphodiesterase class I)